MECLSTNLPKTSPATESQGWLESRLAAFDERCEAEKARPDGYEVGLGDVTLSASGTVDRSRMRGAASRALCRPNFVL
jgi:hypothetical protein